MKHQYFGDVNDYRKYGLLRALLTPGALSLSVAWMLTPDDGSSDGGFRSYLREPSTWRHYDEPLFDDICGLLSQGQVPSVAMIERTSILPRACFFSQMVPDERSARTRWGVRLVEATSGVDLVFLDPDNGVEIPSKPLGRKDSSKYAAWQEIERLWEAGSSVLIYQHYCRERRDTFTARVAGELQRRTGSRFVEVFRTAYALFLLAAQRHHTDVFKEAVAHHLSTWRGQIAVEGLAGQQTVAPAAARSLRWLGLTQVNG